jgi:hypothetical protein
LFNFRHIASHRDQPLLEKLYSKKVDALIYPDIIDELIMKTTSVTVISTDGVPNTNSVPRAFSAAYDLLSKYSGVDAMIVALTVMFWHNLKAQQSLIVGRVGKNRSPLN